MAEITFKKAAVIGAGTMGSGIAAHLANAGLQVVLLDLDAEVAAGGVTRQLKAGGFMLPDFAKRVTTGSTKSDLSLLADADWIIEAVAERLDIKHALFAALNDVRKQGSVVASNTSTIPLHKLVEGFPAAFAGDLLITHFFNPPRPMRLLELVTGPATKPEIRAAIQHFADVALGKGIVPCKDTPGFIGNRIGCFWLAAGLNEALSLGIDVEEADAAIGKVFGFPNTGIFGLYDLIGNDLMPYLIRSLQQALPAGDPIQHYAAEPPLLAAMIGKGLTGRKGGGGFYRLTADRKGREVLDLATGDYRPQRAVASDSLDAAKGDPRLLLDHPGRAGRYAWKVVSRTLAYSASLVPEIADDPASVDEAMRLGYGWKFGPFELIDKIGPQWLAHKLAAEKSVPVPPLLTAAAEKQGFYRIENGVEESLVPGPSGAPAYRPIALPEGVISLAALKLRAEPVTQTAAATLWDLGDGVANLEFHTKMNTFNAPLLEAVEAAVEFTSKNFKALVIGNEGPVFSAGADLSSMLAMAEKGDSAGLANFIKIGERAFRAVKFAPFPVVGAAFSSALGGGAEILLHCDAIQAHAEVSMGLVEPRAGLIPGWGGCPELLARHLDLGLDPIAAAVATFETILLAQASAGAYDARAKALLRPSDGITMNRDRLIADAKTAALALVPNYAPPSPRQITLSGAAGAAALEASLVKLADRLAPHDHVIGAALIKVLTVGEAAPVDEDAISDCARAAFVELITTTATRDRIAHMVKTGKPLRN